MGHKGFWVALNLQEIQEEKELRKRVIERNYRPLQVRSSCRRLCDKRCYKKS
jgi:hypothetical protein